MRDATERKLRLEMHFAVSRLGCVLEKSALRWLAFKLKRPRPEAPLRSGATPDSAPVEIDFPPSLETTLEGIRAA